MTTSGRRHRRIQSRSKAPIPTLRGCASPLDSPFQESLARRWWKANGVYPIFYVWESGLWDALGALLGRPAAAREAARDLFDWTTDPLVEATAREFGGPKVWAAMKTSAENASRKDGGTTRAASLLKELCDRGPAFSLHAVGHSAGAIFHRFFLDRTKKLGVPAFRTLSLLAPAIAVDDFTHGLMPLAGTHVESVRMYTTHREYEQADVCQAGGVDFYHKSLLYLNYHGLEPVPATPSLGLEDSVTTDPVTLEFFRADRAPDQAKIVWSVGPDSASTSHGGFDNDPATMNSLVKHIRQVDEPTVPYSAARRVSATARPAGRPSPRPSGTGKQALCIGINDYPEPNALRGCVADAQEWAEVLTGLGFDVTTLLDRDATRQNMLEAIRRIVGRRGRPVLRSRDPGRRHRRRRDEGPPRRSPRAGRFGTGSLIIDDDLRSTFATIRTGANITCFMDCCFSETNTRLLRVEQPRLGTTGATPRFLPRSVELDRQYHRLFRAGLRTSGPSGGSATSPLTHVSFSACRHFQVALESDGHRHLTAAAAGLLRDSKALSWTNVEFFQRVLGTIEPGQTPTLEPAGDSRRRPRTPPRRTSTSPAHEDRPPTDARTTGEPPCPADRAGRPRRVVERA